MATYWRNADIRTILDALMDLFDAGSGPAEIRFYDGTPPADADAALSGNTLLATLTMSDPAMGASVDSNPGATATASAITSGTKTPAGSNTVSFGRVLDSAGVVRNQFVAGTSGTEAIFAFLAWPQNLIVGISSMTVFMAESAA